MDHEKWHRGSRWTTGKANFLYGQLMAQISIKLSAIITHRALLLPHFLSLKMRVLVRAMSLESWLLGSHLWL